MERLCQDRYFPSGVKKSSFPEGTYKARLCHFYAYTCKRKNKKREREQVYKMLSANLGIIFYSNMMLFSFIFYNNHIRKKCLK